MLPSPGYLKGEVTSWEQRPYLSCLRTPERTARAEVPGCSVADLLLGGLSHISLLRDTAASRANAAASFLPLALELTAQYVCRTRVTVRSHVQRDVDECMKLLRFFIWTSYSYAVELSSCCS